MKLWNLFVIMNEWIHWIVTEGLDDVYEESGVYHRPHDAYIYDVDTIIKEALDSGKKKEYLMSRHNLDLGKGKLLIHVRRFCPDNPSIHDVGASIQIPTLQISIDMLKRELTKDPHAIKQLGLSSSESPIHDALFGTTKSFTLGHLSHGRFTSLDFTMSLKELGFRNGQEIYVALNQELHKHK
jgi:hypothetical protein